MDIIFSGVYRCGPASVKAIKNAEVYLPYDTGFIFAEVNGDKVRWDVDFSDNSVKAFVTEKSAVGKKISTKLSSQNSARSRLDVTNDYKYPEGKLYMNCACLSLVPIRFPLCYSGRKQWSECSPWIRHRNASLGPASALGEKGGKNRRARLAEGFRAGKLNEYMREIFCPDPLARHEKMEGFQIFFCLIIKRFYS